MTICEMVPSSRSKWLVPVHRGRGTGLFPLQTGMNRLFDEFFDEFGLVPISGVGAQIAQFTPKLDIKETDTEIKIAAELPGMNEKDIELSLEDNVLTIKGEKKQEHDEKDNGYYRAERCYGSFQRTIDLPAEIDWKNVKARFKKGVLTVDLPKVKPTPEKRKIIDISVN